LSKSQEKKPPPGSFLEFENLGNIRVKVELFDSDFGIDESLGCAEFILRPVMRQRVYRKLAKKGKSGVFVSEKPERGLIHCNYSWFDTGVG
jgi:hypothetical protein